MKQMSIINYRKVIIVKKKKNFWGRQIDFNVVCYH